MTKRAVACVIAGAVGLAACGGAPEERPAAAPETMSPADQTASPAGAGAGAPSSATAPEAAPAPGVPPSSTSGGYARPPDARAGARMELQQAETQLSASLGDCATACRALASMERAAEHLCRLDSGDECSDARARVTAARSRVQTSCGGCSP